MIKDFYNNTVEAEWKRLDAHWLEFETTYYHITNNISKSAKILDIGGGPGRYAFRLAKDGYSVFLGDLSDRNIEFAQKYEKDSGIQLLGTLQMDACDLSHFDDDTFDAVLCLGPFYHVQDKIMRQKIIGELQRVTKPAGIVFAAFITHYAPIYDFIKRIPETIGNNRGKLVHWYKSGLYSPPISSKGFPTAFFVRPDEVSEFFSNSQISPMYIFGCEGILNQSEKKLELMEPSIRDQWLGLSIEFSRTAISIASSEHIVFVGKNS